ncbi:phage major capsid protein [Duganella sp.]|uniref:phage major capsid protein n=1 Tax=Duganella sp. TaxID=1904440 RepID=UPI0031DFE5D1
MNIQALREKIQNLATQANNLIANKGDSTWTKEEQSQFDGWADEIAQLKNQIAAVEKMRSLEAENFFADKPKKQGAEEVEITDLVAVALYLRNGTNVTAEQAAAIRNAMSTTTPSEGGYTVPAEIAAMVIDKLKAYGGMRAVAEIIPTESGGALNFPTSDGTGEEGEIVGENAATTGQDITFGTAPLATYKYSSKKIALPVELIMDSAIDVIAFVLNRLVTRIARIQNRHFTTGTGTGQPFGIVTQAGTGKIGATGQTLSVLYDDLVDLKHSVNRAYRANARFMMNDMSVAVVSKLKDTTGRPIWVPSVTSDVPDTLLGFKVEINDDVAVMAASAKSIVFGDLSKYAIRDVKNSASLRRFDDSAFALNGQVGFCGWQRSGGNLLDPAAVKVYQNSAT